MIKALFLFIGPRRVLNSLNNKYNTLFQIKEIREGKNQNEYGIIINPINVLIQFKDKLKIVVDGSKTENKLVIIFN